MISACRGDANFEAAVQLAGWIIDVGLAPRDDDATLDSYVLQRARIDRTQRHHELGHGFQRSIQQIRAERLRRISRPVRRSDIGRYRLQANWIPGEISQAIAVADHLAEWTRHERGARRQIRARGQSEADAIFKPVK